MLHLAALNRFPHLTPQDSSKFRSLCSSIWSLLLLNCLYIKVIKQSSAKRYNWWFVIIDSAESIVGPLAYIVNLSIRSGVFPDDLKRSKIVPIYKKKAKTEPGNYRPVSVLSVISKVLERVICEQLTDYIEKHDYLYELSGFRSSYSTDSCLIHLSNHILKNQDSVFIFNNWVEFLGTM